MNKLKSHKNIIIKSALYEVWIYWTYNRIDVFDIIAHNEQSCTGIEPFLLSSAERLQRSVLAFGATDSLREQKQREIYTQPM